MTNKEFAEKDEHFRMCCEFVKIKPTARQVSKWMMAKGLAWTHRREAEQANETTRQ